MVSNLCSILSIDQTNFDNASHEMSIQLSQLALGDNAIQMDYEEEDEIQEEKAEEYHQDFIDFCNQLK